ncbi:MAG: RNA-directed DNA polymerase [bacterium]
MEIKDLASKRNLELAWRRITTGGNHPYKRFFRELYYIYEVALSDNLADLRKRLKGWAFAANQAERVYLPKKSGLHRPISLLRIEDQIVLQAFANLAAKRLYRKRKPFQFKAVFSNILIDDKSIFFFEPWQVTYGAFQSRIKKHYEAGLRWVADFDLAAFYDTISHELLIKTIYPNKPTNPDMTWLLQCLRSWSSGKFSTSHGHGLPQGPVASSFLSECFLIPIDKDLQKFEGYVRYVDDIRLFGRTEDEVREAVIRLETRCSERGLIPQIGKFAIKRVYSPEEAMAILPSVAEPQREQRQPAIPRARAIKWAYSAVNGKPYKVVDKTRLRYVLFRAAPDNKILNLVLRLIPRHPEHAEAFFCYLAEFDVRKPITRLCLEILKKNPYPYVRGEAWHVLARYLKTPRGIEERYKEELKRKAINLAKSKTAESFMERWGACHFLAVFESIYRQRLSRWLNYQPPLLKALLARALPDTSFGPCPKAVGHYLRHSAPEPGLSICPRIHELGLELGTLGYEEKQLPSQVCNTLRELGVIHTTKTRVDAIGEILRARYQVDTPKSWYTLLATEYGHALGILRIAEATFDTGRSNWLKYQNSFNDAIFRALQRHLDSIKHLGSCKIIDRKGHLINFGVLLAPKTPFSRHCPKVAKCFRHINDRRNRLPGSHPYEKKTASRCRYLTKQERNRFVAELIPAYADFAALMP